MKKLLEKSSLDDDGTGANAVHEAVMGGVGNEDDVWEDVPGESTHIVVDFSKV